MKVIKSVILFYLISLNILSQNDVDSLFNKLYSFRVNDSNKLNTAILICKKLNKYGSYKRNISFCDTALKIETENNNSIKRGMILINKAIACAYLSDYPSAISIYYEALKIFEKEKFELGKSKCYTNLGIIFYEQKQYYKSLNLYFKARDIVAKYNLTDDLANCYNNIGIVYDDLDKIDSAIYFYNKSIEYGKINNNLEIISFVNDNLTTLYFNQNDFQKALKLAEENIKIFIEIKNEYGISFGNITLGLIYNELNQPDKAIKYYKNALNYASKENAKTELRDIYKGLSKSYELKGNLKQALEYYKIFKETADTIFNSENSIAINDAKTNFELEKKEIELKTLAKAELDKINLKNSEEKQRQQIIIYSVSGGLLLLILLVLFVYKGLKQKQRDNIIIKKQKNEVEHAKHLIEEKQKEILDSIHYAKRLQEAILPPLHFINEHVPNNFVLYQPKDLVAGDFYWAETKDDKFFIAAADCTGHGVPGAMVSVVCSNALNRTVNEFGINDTGEILDKTRELVLETFAKGNAEVKDGMDISLLCIDKQNKKVFWSGANNPLWYVKSSVTSSAVEKSTDAGLDSARHDTMVASSTSATIVEIKADKQPIGKTDHAKPFTTHEIALHEGMLFYLFTDGFADQFGGPKGKKFKYKQLEELLLANANKSMNEQHEILIQQFNLWKGDLEQIDDVCVIGVRL